MLAKLSEIRTFGYILFGFRTLYNVWKPNKFVRISALFWTERYFEPNDKGLTKIRTCSDFGRWLY